MGHTGEKRDSLWEKVKERDHLEDLAIVEKLILIWSLKN
jgi:hypothetical protein